MKRLLLLPAAALVLGSCVSTKNYNNLKAHSLRLEAELSACNSRVEELNSGNDGLSQRGEALLAELELLRSDHKELDAKYRRVLTEGSDEAARMLRQIEANQRQLEELEQMLRARDQAIVSLRKKVGDALLGFEGKGLTVSTRDGKVYVSMDDKLLFKSGSFDIDPNGAEAVRELAKVLAQNPDIEIMVEGHTDDVPYRGTGQLRDNLDLSVKRATTVVRLLLENDGIDPVRIIAAGRGEYLPVDKFKTTEARARNRRTEIILSPRLDELMQILDR